MFFSLQYSNLSQNMITKANFNILYLMNSWFILFWFNYIFGFILTSYEKVF